MDIHKLYTRGDIVITCSVCGCLNDPSNMVCEECGSDLIDESELEYLYGDD